MIESAHIDWDNTALLIPYFKIICTPDYVGWSAYSDLYGADVATCHAPTRQEAIEELIDWLQGYIEKRYPAMYDEAGFLP